ncbi:hypothetical protein BJX70DRAFT_338021 [Aspergillus crustosus]
MAHNCFLYFSLFLTVFIFTALTTASPPPCIQTCITTHPSHSWCDGTETDRTLTECLCRGLDGSSMLDCMRQCSPEDQWEYSSDIPSGCREKVFPEAVEADGDRNGNEGNAMITGSTGWRIYGGVALVVSMGLSS